MSDGSRIFAGILLIAVLVVQLGGFALLTMHTRRMPGWDDNQMRRGMFRAGHAHAGVWIILALVGMLYVDQTDLSDGVKWLVRICLAAAPILVSLGFFFSVLSPRAERPNGMVGFVYVGAVSLTVAAVTLGIGLLTA